MERVHLVLLLPLILTKQHCVVWRKPGYLSSLTDIYATNICSSIISSSGSRHRLRSSSVDLLNSSQDLNFDPYITFRFDVFLALFIHTFNKFNYMGRHILPRHARF